MNAWEQEVAHKVEATLTRAKEEAKQIVAEAKEEAKQIVAEAKSLVSKDTAPITVPADGVVVSTASGTDPGGLDKPEVA